MKNTNNDTGYRHEIVFLHQQGDFQVLFTENLAFLAFALHLSKKVKETGQRNLSSMDKRRSDRPKKLNTADKQYQRVISFENSPLKI